jgi:hypothetical protein
MNVTWIDPADRFDGASLSDELVEGRSLPRMIFYSCPRCAERVGFNRDHFERAVDKTTRLPVDVGRAIDAAAEKRKLTNTAFLDWICPKCKLGVRVYADVWAGGMHGNSGAEIVSIAEVEHAF